MPKLAQRRSEQLEQRLDMAGRRVERLRERVEAAAEPIRRRLMPTVDRLAAEHRRTAASVERLRSRPRGTAALRREADWACREILSEATMTEADLECHLAADVVAYRRAVEHQLALLRAWLDELHDESALLDGAVEAEAAGRLSRAEDAYRGAAQHLADLEDIPVGIVRAAVATAIDETSLRARGVGLALHPRRRH